MRLYFHEDGSVTPISDEEKKEIKVQKRHTITFHRNDLFSWAGIYESIVRTLIDENVLSISRHDDGNKVEFTWFLI